MSDILIKGVEMPTDHPLWIVVHSDGTVEANEVSPSRPVGWQTLRNAAVPVPPHGRLGDLDELYSHLNEWYLTNRSGMSPTEAMYIRAMLAGIAEAPTIVEAVSLPVLHGTFAASSKEEATRRLTGEDET